MDNIFINLDDGVNLGGDYVPQLGAQPDIISQSDVISGPVGPAGPAGKDGKDGQAATITVGSTTTGAAGTNAQVQNSGTSSAAVLNFTIPRGDTGTPATIEIGETNTLPEGSDATVTNTGTSSAAVFNFGIPKGDTGATGQAATITVGSVQTVAPEYPATVNNSGTSSAAVLDFEIPQGVKGDTGDTGPAGADGRDGTDGQAATITVGSTTTGAAGSSATVTNSGTTSAAVLNFTIPRGDTGATGATGATGPAGADGRDGTDGQAATIAVGTTTTGAAGTNASVTNSGTSSAAIFNFTIPRGETGATGATGSTGPAGADGADGFSPTATVTQNTGSATISITDKNGTTTATVYDGVTPDTSVTSYSLTNLPAHSGGTNGYVLRKQFNVVCLDIDVIWLNSISANSWTSIGTLPAACYPSASICTTVVLTNGSNGQVVGYGKMNLQTNGNVRVSLATGLSSLCAISGAITYII